MTRSTALDDDVASDALNELLTKRTSSSSKVLIGILAASLLLAGQVWGQVASGWVLGWLVLVVLSQWARVHAEKLSASEAPIEQRKRWSMLGSVPAGVALGCSVLFFPFEDKGAQSLHTLILLTLVAASVVYTSGNPGPNDVFSISITTPTILGWTYEGLVGKDWTQLLVAALIVIYAINVRSYARDHWQMFLEAANMRRQLRTRAEELQSALHSAELANQAKTRFLASASHDLRQPIHTISVLTSTLKLRHSDGRSADVLKLLDAVVLGLSHLLDDLLDISKLDAGVVQINKQELALAPFIEERSREFEQEAKAKGIELNCRIHDRSWAYTDPLLLERMLRNLLHNSLKFTPQGKVELSLREIHGMAEIVCSDSGVGIPANQLEAVFDEFHQLNNPQRDREKGLGLGLSIVKRLAGLLGVQVELSSSLGEGTRVRLTLPICEPPQESGSISGIAEVATASPPANGLRVLVVDDERQICEGMRILLEEMGYACQIAHDTVEAEGILERWYPHIMITDYRLTRSGDGLEFAASQRIIRPDLNILMITGDTGPGPLQDITQAGLNVLHKPVPLSALSSHLASITPRAAAAAAPG